MSDLSQQLKAAAVTAADAPTGVDVVLLADALRIAALSVAPAPVAANPFADEFSEEALNEIAESAQKLSFALGRGEIDGDDSATYLICRFLDEIAECVTDAGIKWNDEDGSLHIPAPPVQEGPKVVAWLLRVRPSFQAGRGKYERANHCGYTNDVLDAGRFTEAEAKEYEADCPDKLEAIPAPYTSPAQSIPAAIDEEGGKHG